MESCWKEDLEELFCTVHSHLTSFNIHRATRHLYGWGSCVGIHRAIALIDDAKQASGKGARDLVETGLT